MKDIKDYLHFYLGCYCLTEVGFGKIEAIHQTKYRTQVGVGYGFNNRAIKLHYSEEVKPILRLLSSMTEEEMTELYNTVQPEDISRKKADDIAFKVDLVKRGIIYGDNWLSQNGYFRIIPYLTSHGFDIFGLIESGLAIDKSSNP